MTRKGQIKDWRLKRLLCTTALLILGIGSAIAQSYPNKPIRFLVGFPAGSSNDMVARVVAAQVSKKLGQVVVVENRIGANGMLAAAELARAQPDGYTVFISNSSTITVNPLLYKNLQYDIEKDFAPVSLLVSSPFILTINPDNEQTASVSKVGDLMTLARNKPDHLSYGSSGLGNLAHLSFELLNRMAGVQMVHVPYRGTPQMMSALLGKEFAAAFNVPAATIPQIKAGKLKALAVSSQQRWRDLPDVPSIAEQGYPDFDISFWFGAFVPAQTSQATVNTLYDAIKSAGDDPETRRLLLQHGDILMLNPQQLTARIRAETKQFADIIKRSNIQLE